MHVLFIINGMQHGNSNLGRGTGATRCRQHARRNSRHNEVSFLFDGAFFILFNCVFTRYFFHFLTKGVSKDSKVACQNLLILLSIDNSIANISLYELSKPLNFFKVRFWLNTRHVLAGYSVPAIFVYV